MNRPKVRELIKSTIADIGLKPKRDPRLLQPIIQHEVFEVMPMTTTTVCCLILTNGETVIGSSQCPEDEYNSEHEEAKARWDAFVVLCDVLDEVVDQKHKQPELFLVN